MARPRSFQNGKAELKKAKQIISQYYKCDYFIELHTPYQLHTQKVVVLLWGGGGD